MNRLIITLLGQDRVGIVESVAQLVFKHNGNWLGSSMSHLAGQFAGIVEVSISDEEVEPLKAELNQLPDLMFSYQSGVEHQHSQLTHLLLSITANDRPGILKQVTQVLTKANASVVQMDTFCTAAANWGSALFEATIKADISGSSSIDELKDAIEDIADDIMIDCEIVQKF